MNNAQSSFQAARLHRGTAAIVRLRELDIEVADLMAALDAGEVGARLPDQYFPVMASGTSRWFETVGMLRRTLAARGWEIDDPRNSPRATNPRTGIAVVAASGNWRTGLDQGDPQTARAKGEATARAVQVNVQLEFDLSSHLADSAAERADSIATWVLLYRRDEELNELRAELSRPVGMMVNGLVTSWRERILLEPRTFGPDVRTPRDAKGGSDVDFTIEAV